MNLKYFNYTYHNTAALTIIAISIFILFTVNIFVATIGSGARGRSKFEYKHTIQCHSREITSNLYLLDFYTDTNGFNF